MYEYVYVDGTCHSQRMSTPRTKPGHYPRCKSWDHTHTAHALSIKSPLISIPLDHIVLDELYLLLRIGDVLLRNLIWYMDSLDHCSKAHMGKQTNHIRQLEEAIHSCGVSFHVWQNREPSGKPIPGSFDFTPLSGKDKLKVFNKLPAKMDSLLSEDSGMYATICTSVTVLHVHLYISRISTSSILSFQVPRHPRPRLTLFMRRYSNL